MGFERFYQNIIRKHNLKTALVTNTSRDIILKIRECINIDDYFSIIISSSDVSDPKPSPVPYSKAMRELSVEPENTVIIEDSRVGFKSALASEAHVIGITSTLLASDIYVIDEKIDVFDNYNRPTNYIHLSNVQRLLHMIKHQKLNLNNKGARRNLII